MVDLDRAVGIATS